LDDFLFGREIVQLEKIEQAFEAFDTFEDIGEISSKGCARHPFETFEDLALRATTFEPRDPPCWQP